MQTARVKTRSEHQSKATHHPTKINQLNKHTTAHHSTPQHTTAPQHKPKEKGEQQKEVGSYLDGVIRWPFKLTHNAPISMHRTNLKPAKHTTIRKHSKQKPSPHTTPNNTRHANTTDLARREERKNSENNSTNAHTHTHTHTHTLTHTHTHTHTHTTHNSQHTTQHTTHNTTHTQHTTQTSRHNTNHTNLLVFVGCTCSKRKAAARLRSTYGYSDNSESTNNE
jgi:hypothetical protein